MNKVTEVEIIPIKPQEGLVAFASLVIDGWYLSSIGIHSKLDGSGYRLTYPTKLVGTRQINLFHPINRDTTRVVEEAVMAKFIEVIEGSNHGRYSRSHFTA